MYLIRHISLRVCVCILLCAGCILSISNNGAAVKRQSYDASELASYIIEMAGISRGVCSILGCNDESLILEIVRPGKLFVHIQDPSGDAAESLKKKLYNEGLYGKRAVVERGSLKPLPYLDNTIDLVIASSLTASELNELSLSEVMRVLRPRGKAIFGSMKKGSGSYDALTQEKLKGWLDNANIGDFRIKDDNIFGLWALVTKPPMEGVDDWSHWEHSPDNNPVSTDKVIKAPYMTQWLAHPLYIAMPAVTIAAGGRTFCAMGHIAHHKREEQWLNTLYARNGYNGEKLWTRKLPDGYLVHRSAFIATENTFYMIDPDGTGCLLLDPETGEEKDRIHVPEISGEWKWIAIKDGVLFALSGKEKDPSQTTVVRSQITHWSWSELSKGYYEKRVPWGFGTVFLAYDLNKKKVMWTHKEDVPVDSRAMTMGEGKIFFYGPDSHIGCLDEQSGKLLWTNSDPRVRELIEEPGKGLKSTPGFRTACFCLYTPKALFYEAQTRMNIVAVSKENGSLLWYKQKTTNNPNMLYTDDHILVGIGPDGNTLVLDPLKGTTIEDLGFRKRSCVRLTATYDSYFCRGWIEGLTRYDRNSKKILFNGAFRPSCQDGVIPANGLLYMGPWMCDCNLTLMGAIALCSAGDFTFEHAADEKERLETPERDFTSEAILEVSEEDWHTYRGNNGRSACSKAAVSNEVKKIWEFSPRSPVKLTAPTAAGSLIFLGGEDCKVRAIDAATGNLKWSFMTAGPIMQPPTIWNGRAYVGSGDGYIYTLDAAAGRLLWRFRASPVERRIMVYGSLCSTWPVNSGVLVKDGTAYAAAGIIDYDGTYVYALDAVTGKIKWQNNSSGHLDKELRKGVSAQGILAATDDLLWMAGGNVVSPAVYDLAAGTYCGESAGNGSPKANRGEEIGVFNDQYVILGGRLLYSAAKNVVNPGKFEAFQNLPGGGIGKPVLVNTGKIPPAWDDNRIVFVDGRHTIPACYTADSFEDYLKNGGKDRKRPEPVWTADKLELGGPESKRQPHKPNEIDVVSIALAHNAVLVVLEMSIFRSLQKRWAVCSLDPQDGSMIWKRMLSAPAMSGGLTIDRDGRVIVVMENGNVACFGG